MLASCECVPIIDTPKKILPTEFGNVILINAIDDISGLNAYQNGIVIKNNLENLSASENYNKIEVGLTNIATFDNSSNERIVSFVGDIEINRYYSAVFYGSKKFTSCFFIPDSIENFPKSNACIRFMNLNLESTICFSFEKNTAYQKLPINSYSNLFGFAAFSDRIIIQNSSGETIYVSPEINFASNTIYNIIYTSSLRIVETPLAK